MIKKVFLGYIVFITLTPFSFAKTPNKQNIGHIVVLYFENRSFDNLFRGFKGADTSDHPNTPYAKQIDEQGKSYKTLPLTPTLIDKGMVHPLPNAPFLLDTYISQETMMPDLIHRFYQNISQINGGKNDRFVQISDEKALTMGYHDMEKSHLWHYAKEYVLCDNFFAAAYGGSFLNHQWLIAAQTPHLAKPYRHNFPHYELTENNETLKDGVLTPDGYVVNTVQPFSPPYKAKFQDKSLRLPPLTYDTIGERLGEKQITWRWYSGDYDEAMKGEGDKVHYQYHHNPFVYFANYDVGTKGRTHIKDEKDFLYDIQNSTLPQVSFYKPSAFDNQHPGYATVKSADEKLHQIVQTIQQNKKIWKRCVIIVTYDENGGLWDHKTPPTIDRWGVGTRIPAVIISPFAKKSFVDHTFYDTTSILKFIEWRFELKPLTQRDKNANNLINALYLK